MMTLMSFAVSIGALISNSIVVIENIVRLKKGGIPIKQAAIEGTSEVTMAVIASTGTNLVVFLPMAMMSSMTVSYTHLKDVDNTSDKYVLPWIEAVKEIAPRQVMIYTIDRETPDHDLQKATHEELNHIVTLLEKEGISATASY